MNEVISVAGLDVKLAGRLILDDISFSVAPGEVVALLGANGSGKSTLIKTLVGINPVSDGTVTLFGDPIGPRVPWERLGYVPQRISAGSGVPATAAEVVASGMLSGRRLRPGRGTREAVHTALKHVDLDDHADKPVDVLSGGQQQRVLIARALVRKPDLLLLDEPVSGVDAPSQAAFAQVLTSLTETGTTVVVVLHEIGVFSALIERSIVLRQGRVIHDGAPPQPQREHAAHIHDHVHPHTGPRADRHRPSATVRLTMEPGQ